MALLATALACLAMHPGCGGPPMLTPAPPSGFALAYERSGGLKTMPRKLKIGPDRVGTLEERRTRPGGGEGAATHFKVPAKTLVGLRRALNRAGFASLPDPGPSPGTCADCYSYEIHYRHHDVTFDDATMPESLRPVVARLEAIADAHRPLH